MASRKASHWKDVLRDWRQPEQLKVHAFLSRIFREQWEEDEVHCGSTKENGRPMGFTYSVTAALTEDLPQKLNPEPRGNGSLDHGDGVSSF